MLHDTCAMMHSQLPLSESDVVVSYLPLSHIAASCIDLFQSVYCGGRVHFADADALKGSLKNTLLAANPTLFFGVPRVWEKMKTAMAAKAEATYAEAGAKSKGKEKLLRGIGAWCKRAGGKYNVPGRGVAWPWVSAAYAVARVLAFKKVRKGLGLTRAWACFTGAAPLGADVAAYFRSVDICLLEVYGMSESCGALAVCGPERDERRPEGSCGKALPGLDVRVAEDGEITVAGTNVMPGYLGNAAATAEALAGGVLHTGDVGVIDENGFVTITGRKKDIIITAGGENVAPSPIEFALLAQIGPKASHVIVLGDRQRFLSALVSPAETGPAPTVEEVETAVAAYNISDAKSRAQRVNAFRILPRTLSEDHGELTPTQKVKRNVVMQNCEAQIKDIYEGPSQAGVPPVPSSAFS